MTALNEQSLPAGEATGSVRAASAPPQDADARILLPGPARLPQWPYVPSLRVGELAFARFATVAAVLLLGAIAAVTVASSWSVLPKPTFGTWQDYLALAVAAFGASAITNLVATFALWRTSEPAVKG